MMDIQVDPLRRLALSVAAMSTDDRHWLLQQLDSMQRSRLLALIDEIEQLGLNQDPDALSAIWHEPATTSKSLDFEFSDQVIQGDVRWLAVVYDRLPTSIQSQLQSKMDMPRRNKLQRFREEMPSFGEAIIESTLNYLELSAVAIPAQQKTSNPQ